MSTATNIRAAWTTRARPEIVKRDRSRFTVADYTRAPEPIRARHREAFAAGEVGYFTPELCAYLRDHGERDEAAAVRGRACTDWLERSFTPAR